LTYIARNVGFVGPKYCCDEHQRGTNDGKLNNHVVQMIERSPRKQTDTEITAFSLPIWHNQRRRGGVFGGSGNY